MNLLTHSSEEMEQKKLTIEELRTEAANLRYSGAETDKAAAGEMARRRKRRETEFFSIKNFLKKGISFPARSVFWTKNASV